MNKPRKINSPEASNKSRNQQIQDPKFQKKKTKEKEKPYPKSQPRRRRTGLFDTKFGNCLTFGQRKKIKILKIRRLKTKLMGLRLKVQSFLGINPNGPKPQELGFGL